MIPLRRILLPRLVVLLAAAAAALPLLGCASDGASSGYTALWGAAGPGTQVPLLVASTRRDDGRDTGSQAHFSSVLISIPPNHRPGVIERAAFGRNARGRDFTVASNRPLEEREFLAEIAERAANGGGADVLLYVHGYDISLQEARFRAAQIVADSGFTGVPALFAWESISRSGLAAYEADKESATVARDALESLILDLSKTSGVRRVHVLAHSMGAWLAMESLRAIAIAGHADLDGRLGEVMLAAPDVDLSVFSQQLLRVGPEHVTIFVSNSDRALSLSSKIAGGRPRLGAMDPSNPRDREALQALGVSVLDISRLNTDFVGHNTFAEAPAVVRQIGAQLAAAEEDEPGDPREARDAREEP